MGKLLQHYKYLVCKIFRILLKHVSDHLSVLFKLHDCTFKERQVLMNRIRDIDSYFIDHNENSFGYTLFFGKENMNNSENIYILNSIIEYILSTEMFSVPLFE